MNSISIEAAREHARQMFHDFVHARRVQTYQESVYQHADTRARSAMEAYNRAYKEYVWLWVTENRITLVKPFERGDYQFDVKDTYVTCNGVRYAMTYFLTPDKWENDPIMVYGQRLNKLGHRYGDVLQLINYTFKKENT